MHQRPQVIEKKSDIKKGSSAQKAQNSEFSSSTCTPTDYILSLQRTIGNKAVQRLFKDVRGLLSAVGGQIQAKLKIGQPGDVYEQEADRVADEVLRMPEPQVEGEEEELLQAKITGDVIPEVTRDLESQINTIRGGGKPLSESERAFFEPRFGYDFRDVRVHTDLQAADSAQVMNARAYTVGKNVVFNERQYAPETTSGRLLIAHELVHVLQQRFGEVGHSMGKVSNGDLDGDTVGTRRVLGEQKGGSRVLPVTRSYELRIQRIIARVSRDDPTSRAARQQIEEARELLNDPTLDSSRRRSLSSRIEEAEAALETYRSTVDSTSFGMSPMVAQAGTQARGPVTAIAVTIFALVAWISANTGSRTVTNRQAADALGEALNVLGEAVAGIYASASFEQMQITLMIMGWISEFSDMFPGPGPENFQACLRRFVMCLVNRAFETSWVPEVEEASELVFWLEMPEDTRNIWENCMDHFMRCMGILR